MSTPHLPDRIRAALDEERELVGAERITVARFSAVLRLHRVTVSKMLAGSAPTIATLRRIALVTGRSADFFLGLSECPECGRTVDEADARMHCVVRARL